MRTWRTQGKRPGRLAQPSPECAPRRATKRHAQPHCIAPQRLASLDRSVSPVTNVASAWPMTPRCRTHPRQCDAGRSPERRVGMLVSAPCWQGSQGRFERRAWLWQRKENGTTLTYLNTLYTDARPVGASRWAQSGKWGSQGHGAWVRALMQRAAGSRCGRPGGGELGRGGRRAVRPAAPPSWSSRLWRRRAQGG